MKRVWLKTETFTAVTDEELDRQISELAGEARWAQVQGAGIDRFYRVSDSGMMDENGTTADARMLYDVRAFGPEVELHAVRRGARWQVTVATESDSEVAGASRVEASSHMALIWGEASRTATSEGGWTIMESQQVGKIAVPVETSGRATLETVEYRDHTEQGNAYLKYSRLSTIRAVAREGDDVNG